MSKEMHYLLTMRIETPNGWEDVTHHGVVTVWPTRSTRQKVQDDLVLQTLNELGERGVKIRHFQPTSFQLADNEL